MSKFQIHVKDLRGLPVIKRKPMEGEPRLYIALSIDETQKHTRTTEQTQTGSLRWEQFLEFSTMPDPESNLRIQLFRSHSIKKAEIIGNIERRMGDILAHGSGKDNVILLQYNDRLPGNTVLELTICVFGLEDLQQQARAIKEDVNHAAERVDSSEPSDVVDRVTSAVKIAQDTLDPWKTLLDRIDIIVKITEKLAQIWKRERERGNRILELVALMNDVCDFTDNTAQDEELKPRTNIIDVMMQQIIDCGIFIQNYCKDGDTFLDRVFPTASRALKHELSNVDQAIMTYRQNFTELKKKFHQWTSLGTEVRVVRLADAIVDMAADITLLQLQCAPDAGYKSDKCCLPGTRIKVTKQVCEWVGNIYDSTRVYLLTGPAGAGKSSIADSVYQSCKESNFGGSFFAFSRNNPARLEHCFRTIAPDLASCDKMIKQSLSNTLAKDPSLADTSSLPDQFEKMLMESIQRLSVSRPILIAIDALDEAGTFKTRGKILKLLTNQEYLARIPSSIRFFITSRPEKDILEYFQNKENIQCAHLAEANSELTEDIYKVVYERLKNPQGQLYKGIKHEHCHYIALKAEGLFQWAAVVCDFIKGEGKGGQNILKRYNKLFESTNDSAKSIYWLYSQVLISQ
ncbi:hypothetical protein M422DRAFT_251822 [Sphaerobolus stellatus SS14]|uniref:C2 domain-containing protein n=1 Tax=Sphaerobolus stellatus (strain SS14) TaxID=990650 RepID=A0A0C9W0A4_SPHS4|nr:hypothetical protein M422DRAFT_251822 [Sphaerobolus stellatus SS14]